MGRKDEKFYTRVVLAGMMVVGGVLTGCSAESSTAINEGPTTQDVPGGNASDWELVENLSDEFNDGTISPDKWNTSPSSWGAWSWDPENTTEKDGLLDITMRQKEHTAKLPDNDGKLVDVNLDYTSGILKSKSSQVFGYYEARIKGVDTFPGSSPAFWLYSDDQEVKDAGLLSYIEGDTAYSEVDVVEMQQEEDIHILDMHPPKQVFRNGKAEWVRSKQDPYLLQSKIKADFDPSKDFHTYGVMVSEQELTWYLDGKEVFSQPNTNWNRLPMHVTLSLGLRAPNLTYENCPDNLRRCPTPDAGKATGYPTTMQVDWVRVYKKKPGTGPL